MILLDTHIWVWWLNGNNSGAPQASELSVRQREILSPERSDRLAISAITCWEVAKLVEKGRLKLNCPVEKWMAMATKELDLLPLSWEIAVLSTQLGDGFHKDPADQIIVATALKHNIALLTQDGKIIEYTTNSNLQLCQ